MVEKKAKEDMVIKLSPLHAVTAGKVAFGPAGRFEVEVGGTRIGFSEVKILLQAGERHGSLELIRGERLNGRAGDIAVGNDVIVENGVEGFGYKLLIRRFKFSSWGIEDGSLVFVDCNRF